MEEQELKNRKLIVEIRKLHLEIRALQRENRQTFGKRVKNWIGFISLIVGLFVAVWGLFSPVASYVESQAKKTTYELNSNMIGLVTNSKTLDEKNRAITLLAYYEGNSLPILIFFLESVSFDSSKSTIINSIARIYEQGDNDKVFSEIEKSFVSFCKRFFASQDNKAVFLNYKDLFLSLPLSVGAKKDLVKDLSQFKEVLTRTVSESQDSIFYSIEVGDLINEISPEKTK